MIDATANMSDRPTPNASPAESALLERDTSVENVLESTDRKRVGLPKSSTAPRMRSDCHMTSRLYCCTSCLRILASDCGACASRDMMGLRSIRISDTFGNAILIARLGCNMVNEAEMPASTMLSTYTICAAGELSASSCCADLKWLKPAACTRRSRTRGARCIVTTAVAAAVANGPGAVACAAAVLRPNNDGSVEPSECNVPPSRRMTIGASVRLSLRTCRFHGTGSVMAASRAANGACPAYAAVPPIESSVGSVACSSAVVTVTLPMCWLMYTPPPRSGLTLRRTSCSRKHSNSSPLVFAVWYTSTESFGTLMSISGIRLRAAGVCSSAITCTDKADSVPLVEVAAAIDAATFGSDGSAGGNMASPLGSVAKWPMYRRSVTTVMSPL